MPAGRPQSLDLEAAMPVILRHFWHDGYAGATIDQVAAELGVTKPTVYRAFGEKEAVFAAALDTYHRAYIAPAEQHLEQAATLRDALTGFFAVFVDRIVDDDLPAGCFLGDSAMAGTFTTGPIAATIDRLQGRLGSLVQQRVEAAINGGELEPATSVAAVVPFVLGQVSALSAISRTGPTRSQLDSVVGYMLAGLPWVRKR
jgi:AcrR family transcriptional regulator|tara:strand:+ start:97 stop:699 length:603 start_codon:yes stop_codon:yes gene_type:complete